MPNLGFLEILGNLDQIITRKWLIFSQNSNRLNFEHIKTEAGAVSVDENVFLFGGFEQGSGDLNRSVRDQRQYKSRTNFDQTVPGSLVWITIEELTLEKYHSRNWLSTIFQYKTGNIGPV